MEYDKFSSVCKASTVKQTKKGMSSPFPKFSFKIHLRNIFQDITSLLLFQ